MLREESVVFGRNTIEQMQDLIIGLKEHTKTETTQTKPINDTGTKEKLTEHDTRLENMERMLQQIMKTMRPETWAQIAAKEAQKAAKTNMEIRLTPIDKQLPKPQNRKQHELKVVTLQTVLENPPPIV